MGDKPTMSVVLRSNAIKQLQSDLSLTNEQKMKATSKALALSSDEKLSNCDAFSLAKFCFETARYNFTRDDSVYPVPYKDKHDIARVQAQIGYQGWKELAYRTGKYMAIDASLVYPSDHVKRDRVTGQLTVEFEEDVSKIDYSAQPIGYYAYAINNDGKLVASVYWTREMAIKHGKRYSKSFNSKNFSSSSLWTTDLDKMGRKSVIKELVTKHLDLSDSLIEAAKKDDQIVFGRESEKDAYLDNPKNEIEADYDVKPTTNVRNTLAPKEEPKPEPEPKAPDMTPITDTIDDDLGF